MFCFSHVTYLLLFGSIFNSTEYFYKRLIEATTEKLMSKDYSSGLSKYL